MLIKISKGLKGSPPKPGDDADLLWTAEHGGTDDAVLNQIPASVLPELAPNFVVGQWYSLEDAKQLLQGAAGDPAEDVWTEIAVLSPSSSRTGHDLIPMQIRKYTAARIIFDSAVAFAEGLQAEGAVWIRVE